MQATKHICMKSVIKPIIITSFLVLILFTPFEKAEAYNGTKTVPYWIKHNALLWTQGKIFNDDFINELR